MSLSIATVLDTRYQKKDGKYPVKLRVIFNRKPKDYPTIFNLTKEDFNKFSAPRVSVQLQEVRTSLDALETDAKNRVRQLYPFSFEAFEEKFAKPHHLIITREKKKKKNKVVVKDQIQDADIDLSKYKEDFPILLEQSPLQDCISATYISYIIRLIEEERIGCAKVYQDSYFSIKSFAGDVPFSKINRSFLVRYEKWMTVEKGDALATVGIKLRGLRAMFNEAIDGTQIISRDIYPFGPKKYRIPSNRGNVRALTKDEIKLLYNFAPKEPIHQRAKYYWFFCYFGNGMNPSDMAGLRYKNIQDNYIRFVRRKTEWTTRENPKVISVYLNDKIRQIIEEWGNEDKNQDNYIFPILQKGMSALEKHKQVRKLCKFISDGMKVIVKELQLGKKANNKVCRKSLATNLKRAGAPTSFIQDTLGHMNITTTDLYLEDYEDDIKKNFSLNLSSFDDE